MPIIYAEGFLASLRLGLLSGLTSVTPKLDSLVNEVIRSFSLNTLILLNDAITMKLVYRLTVNTHTYIISGLALPGLGVVPAWFSPGLQFHRGNIWSLEGVGYTSPHNPGGGGNDEPSDVCC